MPDDYEIIAAQEMGGIIGLIEEVERMIECFTTPDAIAKPRSAWALLPLGFEPDANDRALSQCPNEAPAAKWHADRLSQLRTRLHVYETTAATFEGHVHVHH